MRRATAAIADEIRRFMGNLRFPIEGSSDSSIKGSMEKAKISACSWSSV
jgi:hypothetical protein